MSGYQDIDPSSLGPNMWLIDEMYRRYREDPGAVSEAWKEFFEDFRPALEAGDGSTGVEAPTKAAEATIPPEEHATGDRTEKPAKPPSEREGGSPATGARTLTPPPGAERLRFGRQRIVENMQASLDLPTATSFRIVPAKLLEENRRVINRFLAGGRGGKVSFTHLIGWAVVQAVEAVPAMKAAFASIDGEPYVIRNDVVNLGLAVDVRREDGSRTLLVPNIKGANRLDFAGFWAAYEDVIRRVRSNRLGPDDFTGTTVTLTNPGTIGTQLSVPRLMPGQGLIVATGRVDYPSEYQGADPAALAHLGVGKVVGVTSTYDHRVIQGAESGELLAKIEDLLLGRDRFYEGEFKSLAIPYEPVRWSSDRGAVDGAGAHMEKQAHVLRLINMYRVRGHLLANLNPLGSEVLSHPELDPAFHGLSVWDFDREFFVDDLPGARRQTLRRVLDLLRDAYCGTAGFEYMHIQEPDQKRWIQKRVEGVERSLSVDDKLAIPERLNSAEAFERFLHSKYVGHKRSSLEVA